MKFSYLSVVAFVSTVLGQTQLHPNTATNKCLEVRGNVQVNGTPVQMYVLKVVRVEHTDHGD